MKKDVKPKSPFMEIFIKMAEEALKNKGWNKAELTKKSGASSAVVTLFFQDGMVSSENVFKIFKELGLINTGHREEETCDVGCTPEEKGLGEKAIKILRSKEYGIALQMNILAFFNAIEQKETSEKARRELVEITNREANEELSKYKSEIDLLKEEVKILKEGQAKQPPKPKKTRGDKGFSSLTEEEENGDQEN